MNAILLAASFGTRLRPLTDTIPKCLVPIKNVPLLQIWLERLDAAGIHSFLINTHYLAEKVEEFIVQSGYSERVILSRENDLLGTAGTLSANINFFEGTDGILIHADNYCLADLAVFINAHKNRPRQCLMTMMAFRTQNPLTCGILELDEEGIVVAFHEKKLAQHGNLANGAVYILSPESLLIIKDKFSHAKDFSTEIIPNFLSKIFVYETKEMFLDIGTPETYRLANSQVIQYP